MKTSIVACISIGLLTAVAGCSEVDPSEDDAFGVDESALESSDPRVCKEKIWELPCPNSTTEFSQNSDRLSPASGRLVYSYATYEWGNSGTQGTPVLPVPGIPGYTCGHGRAKLSLTIYGKQASDLYARLNLPEHTVATLPHNTYKRLNVDGTTESEFKEHNIACVKSRTSVEPTCYVNVTTLPGSQSVSKVYPCEFESRVEVMIAQIVGDQAERLSNAIGGTLEAQYKDGNHKVTCAQDARFKKRCVVTATITE